MVKNYILVFLKFFLFCWTPFALKRPFSSDRPIKAFNPTVSIGLPVQLFHTYNHQTVAAKLFKPNLYNLLALSLFDTALEVPPFPPEVPSSSKRAANSSAAAKTDELSFFFFLPALEASSSDRNSNSSSSSLSPSIKSARQLK